MNKTLSTTNFKNLAITTTDPTEMETAYYPVDDYEVATKATVCIPRVYEESGSSFTPDMHYENYFKYTITSNCVLEAPINMQPGHTGMIALQQDQYGGYTIRIDDIYRFVGTNPKLREPAGSRMLLEYTVVQDDLVLLEFKYSAAPFIFTIQTTSPNEEFSLALVSGYDYNMTVNWGDGKKSIVQGWADASKHHVYENPGLYKIIITGKCESIQYGGTNGGTAHKYRNKLISVEQFGTVGWKTFEFMFGIRDNSTDGCMNLVSIKSGECDTSRITSMYTFARRCHNLTSLDLDSMDVSNVTNMSYPFSFVGVDHIHFPTWNTPKITTLRSFCNSTTTVKYLDISNFDTSNVIEMKYFVEAGHILEYVNLTGCDLSNVEDWQLSFDDCPVLLCITNLDTTGGTTKDRMFLGTPALVQPDVAAQADLVDADGANWVNPNPCP